MCFSISQINQQSNSAPCWFIFLLVQIMFSYFDGIHHDVRESTNKVEKWYVKHN
jgi:hypothetical protein